MVEFNPELILTTLAQHNVRFIVVGGVCGLLHGAPLTTFDVDIVHARDPDNITALIGALDELGAIHRHQFGRRLPPSRGALAGRGHQLLTTRAGDLDVLGHIDGGGDYDALAPYTQEISLGGETIAILSLPKLIEVKESLGRPKDKIAVLQLREVLLERPYVDRDRDD